MALKFKSNDLVSPVDIDGNEFIFIFDYVNDVSELEPDALLKATDFNFIFEIKKGDISKSIKITNTCPTERTKGLRFNESVEYTLKKKADSLFDTFFDDELYYFDGEPYRLITPEDKTVNKFKIVNGKTYVNVPKYSLVFYNDAFYVKRLNDKNDNNLISISDAILYGRTTYKSIRKFIIYQLTVNCCALILSIVCFAQII